MPHRRIFSPGNLEMFSWDSSRLPMMGAAKSEEFRLIIRVIAFEVTQFCDHNKIPKRSLRNRERLTDGRTTCDAITALCTLCASRSQN